ncbi:MAG: hypothetical protein LBH42_08310 [Treponema sp.]|jgi:hypothetical protein|nr:hypothetical protein [Treponema sp.]
MQTDMHYYGTLAMAVSAGILKKDAEIIAFAAQFVDDSTNNDSNVHEDHGLLFAISTAHHPLQTLKNRAESKIKKKGMEEEQRKIWIPFHFLPGGEGSSLSEKLLCVKDSVIAQGMLQNNIEAAKKKPYGLELMGITAHVYMDTFSHYGFSGITSSFNMVKNKTISLDKEPLTADYIWKKFKNFTEKYVDAQVAQTASRLGHAGVATFADRPYLQWRFDFEKPRPNNGATSVRNNNTNFLEGCKCLHAYFSKFARAKYDGNGSHRNFDDIEKSVQKVLALEGNMAERIKAWRESGLIDGCETYHPDTWEDEKYRFHQNKTSGEGIATNIYKFHQAATFHRYYVLKDLLPSHGIAVY